MRFACAKICKEKQHCKFFILNLMLSKKIIPNYVLLYSINNWYLIFLIFFLFSCSIIISDTNAWSLYPVGARHMNVYTNIWTTAYNWFNYSNPGQTKNRFDWQATSIDSIKTKKQKQHRDWDWDPHQTKNENIKGIFVSIQIFVDNQGYK